MLISAIFKEVDAIDNYAEIINKLRAEGRAVDADIVAEIRDDEIDHKAKFEAILERLYGWRLEGFF
jgi:rubrerythrin